MKERSSRASKKSSYSEARNSVGKNASLIGIFINLILGLGKLTVGLIFGMLSVMAEGLNNLTDCGTGAVTLAGFKLSGKPADREHPFGHNKVEYIASMIVSFIILLVAIELFKESVMQIITPREKQFSPITLILLCVSCVVKLGMFFFYRAKAKAINSIALKAAAMDSVTDVMSGLVVLCGLLIFAYGGIDIDAYLGMIVSVIIFVGGIKVLAETMKKLLGQSADAETLHAIKQKILGYKGVLGVHDLRVHSYGENNYYVSVHVEVDARQSALKSHELVDKIERDIASDGRVSLVVHMDPVVLDDEERKEYISRLQQLLKNLDPDYTVHDFRVERGGDKTKLIFEVAIPYEASDTPEQISNIIRNNFYKDDDTKELIFKVEYAVE